MKATALNKVKQLTENLYVITETESIHCYLILGSQKVLLFDVGYGYENILPLIREISDLPLMVVLSHGDPDHALGAHHYDEVWMHALDYGKLLEYDSYSVRKAAMDYRLNKMPQCMWEIDGEKFLESNNKCGFTPKFLHDGDIIDLGDKNLQVIHTPGHSYGHIVLLDKQTGDLFSGDFITKHNIWYFMSSDYQAPFASAVNSLHKIIAMQGKINNIYPAHGPIPIEVSCAQDNLECLVEDLPKSYNGDKKFSSFMGEGYQHYYKSVNLIYSDERLSEYLGYEIKRI